MNKPAQFVFAILLSLSPSVHAQDLNSLVPLKSGLVHIVTKNKAGQALGQSSGFIVRDDGVIVTCFHAIRGAIQADIRLDNGDIYDRVEVLDYDTRKDIAILRIKAIKLKPMKLGDSDSV